MQTSNATRNTVSYRKIVPVKTDNRPTRRMIPPQDLEAEISRAVDELTLTPPMSPMKIVQGLLPRLSDTEATAVTRLLRVAQAAVDVVMSSDNPDLLDVGMAMAALRETLGGSP